MHQYNTIQLTMAAGRLVQFRSLHQNKTEVGLDADSPSKGILSNMPHPYHRSGFVGKLGVPL